MLYEYDTNSGHTISHKSMYNMNAVRDLGYNLHTFKESNKQLESNTT